jgi:hypothetical protein
VCGYIDGDGDTYLFLTSFGKSTGPVLIGQHRLYIKKQQPLVYRKRTGSRRGCHYLGQSEASAHFRLGSATIIDDLTFEWPNGFVATCNNVEISKTLRINSDTATTITFCDPGQTNSTESPTVLLGTFGIGAGSGLYLEAAQ